MLGKRNYLPRERPWGADHLIYTSLLKQPTGAGRAQWRHLLPRRAHCCQILGPQNRLQLTEPQDLRSVVGTHKAPPERKTRVQGLAGRIGQQSTEEKADSQNPFLPLRLSPCPETPRGQGAPSQFQSRAW